jgi:peptide/nickel transport system substrate-binding protein
MKKSRMIMVLLVISLLLAACAETSPTASPTQPEATATATLAPTPTPTEIPPLVLNVCMAVEPQGLYRYNGQESLAKASLFSAIYFDLLAKNLADGSPLYFEQEISQESGVIQLDVVPVTSGQPVLDAKGNLVYLSEGTLIEAPFNQSSADPIVWDQSQEYFMNQFRVSFHLKPDLKWSDGQPLTAEDFVFSYHLEERANLGHNKWFLDRTASLIAEDEHTLVWTGIPGFVPNEHLDLIPQPLPEHQLAELSDSDLLTAEVSSQLPAGWGAYRLVSWEPGKQISLEKNPFFVLNAQNLPAFDQLNFLIEPDLETALQKLENGSCDVLDPTYSLEALDKAQLETISTGKKLVAENWQPVQHLVFGIQPALYDQGDYNPWNTSRQDILGNLETRKILSACIDPGSLVNQVLSSRLPAEVSFPLREEINDGTDLGQALEELGWIMTIGLQGDVRIARSVPNVLDDTELRLSLLTGQSALDLSVAELIAERLAACGVAVDISSLPINELYRPGPDGPLFGRNFELALFSWQQEHLKTCQLYTSDQIPNANNSWIGTNLAGLNNAAFDEACWQASTRFPGDLSDQADALMAEYLPALSLMPHYRLWLYSERVSFGDGSQFADIWKFIPIQP